VNHRRGRNGKPCALCTCRQSRCRSRRGWRPERRPFTRAVALGSEKCRSGVAGAHHWRCYGCRQRLCKVPWRGRASANRRALLAEPLLQTLNPRVLTQPLSIPGGGGHCGPQLRILGSAAARQWTRVAPRALRRAAAAAGVLSAQHRRGQGGLGGGGAAARRYEQPLGERELRAAGI